MHLLISSACQMKKELWVFPDEFEKHLYFEASVFNPSRAFQVPLNRQYEKEEIVIRIDWGGRGGVSHPMMKQTV